MPSLISRISSLARSKQGKELADKAQNYAKSPEGKRQVENVRKRFAKKR